MRRILSECSASERKSLQGLDYFAAEGARALDDLVALVRQIGELGSGKEWETTVVQAPMTSKQYLKVDYKVHVTSPSNVADHCVFFALSDSSDADYQQKCTQLAIMSWKCHILGSANQDQARIDALEKLDDNTVLIINDWAMKFLPQKYRESQTDWFGKRGISWHVSVVYRRVSGVLHWQCFLHIVQSCNQGSAAVVKIMQDVLNTIKLEHSEINKAFFRQDNAGCYHSSSTVLSCPVISSSTGIEIKRIDFSDPQGGKGTADRLAATCKNHVRTFINEGNDVTNAEQLKSALLSHGGIEGVREAVVDDNRKIIGINKLNNFEFKDEILVAWRAYGMGKGKEIPLEITSEEHGISWLSSEISSGDFKPLSPKPTQSRKK
ncbi:unnamed protein product [Pocillopora meandrina]|uniref:Uncharacterized protein n=1 Tax=Pocillopora meandrina TaxID=46732 RepID=A0AAU9XU30_9CNID|nr:unnamed protein product [Pocillopora meandrina]